MRFKENTDVLTAQSEKVGEVERVVIDPRTDQVTHVVVRKGFLFTQDKVVPVDLIASATEERVVLREDAGDLESLPEFEIKHYVSLSEKERERTEPQAYTPTPVYWYPPYSIGTPYGGHIPPVIQPYAIETERNIPERTIALKEGAQVISADDEQVGDVEEVFTNPQADQITHFVISEGLLLKEKKLVPYHWVSRLAEDQVHLAVGSEFLDGLPEYGA